jgi:hypothetical protein
MIRETLNKKSAPALTSDRWHLLRASWNGADAPVPRFERTIVSEHETRADARIAARELVRQVQAEVAGRPREQRDQVLVRRPNYKSLKSAKRAERRRQ